MWGDIANIVIAVASVATAIVTARMLIKQHKLQKEQHKLEKEKLNAQQLEHQPSFHSEYDKSGDKRVISCDCYDMWSTAHIELNTIIAVQIQVDDDTTAGYYIPIKYYTSRYFSYKTKGVLAIYTNEDIFNNAAVEKIVKEIYSQVEESLTSKRYISVFVTDVAKIEYTDQYHIKRVVYFLDNDKSTARRYNEFSSIAKAISYRPLKLQDVDVNYHVQEILKMKFTQSLN